MTATLLTEDQRRHLSVSVHLLLADLAELAEHPELGSATDTETGVRGALERTQQAARRLLDVLGLDEPRPRSARRRLLSVAGVWLVRVSELRARALRGYGPLHPDLATTLDPLVAELRDRLRELADSAQQLPGS